MYVHISGMCCYMYVMNLIGVKYMDRLDALYSNAMCMCINVMYMTVIYAICNTQSCNVHQCDLQQCLYTTCRYNIHGCCISIPPHKWSTANVIVNKYRMSSSNWQQWLKCKHLHFPMQIGFLLVELHVISPLKNSFHFVTQYFFRGN